MANLLVQRLHPDAIMPTVAHPGMDLGFDLYALENTILLANYVTRVRTGVAVAMSGCGFRIADRSSMAAQGVRTSGGVIDEGYTGEMFCNLTYTPTHYEWGGENVGSYKIMRGDKIAQFVPQRVETYDPIVLVESLPESPRGNKGYGSTGK